MMPLWKMEYGLPMIPWNEKNIVEQLISFFKVVNAPNMTIEFRTPISKATARRLPKTPPAQLEELTPNWSMLLHFVSYILVHLDRITSNHLEIHIQAIPRVPGKLSHDCLEIWRPCLARWSPWESFTAGHGNTIYDFHGSHKVGFESMSCAWNLQGTFQNLQIPVDSYSDLGVGADTIILAQSNTEAKESNWLSNHFVALHLFTTSTDFRKRPEPHGTARLHPQRPSIWQVESKGWFLQWDYILLSRNSSHLTSNKIYIIYI